MGTALNSKARNQTPISAAEFDGLMASLDVENASKPLAVAVSGGVDSMTLVALTQAWVSVRGGNLTAVIVDHGLRTESTAEADQVRKWLSARGIAAEILEWQGNKPKTGVQAGARAARYGLLGDWCSDHGVTDLLLAHHQDDQAETFLLRLSRGSGIDGLGSMTSISSLPVTGMTGVRLLRPLLAIAKSRLVATAEELGLPWVEDPSNRDPAYTRVRFRGAQEFLDQEGLNADRLATAARRMARASDALNRATQDLLANAARRDRTGYCEIGLDEFLHAPDEIALRALGQMLRWVGVPGAAPRLERLEGLYHRLVTEQSLSGSTLGGCCVDTQVNKNTRRLRVFREAMAADEVLTLQPGSRAIWDGRFQVALESCAKPAVPSSPAVVRRLGDAGWRDIASVVSGTVRRQIPALALPSLPALWDQTGVLSVPLAGYLRPDSTSELTGFTTEITWPDNP